MDIILIITSAFAAISCLYISVIMFSNKGRLFVNSLSYLLLFFSIAKFIDIGNVIVDKSQFLYYSNISYYNFQQNFVSFLSLLVPVLCLKFFTDHWKTKLKKKQRFVLLFLPPIITILISFLFEKIYYSTIIYVYYQIIGLLSFFLLMKNRKYFIQISVFDLLFAVIITYNMFTFIAYYYLFINDVYLSNSILIVQPLGSVPLGTDNSGGIIKLLLNFILIVLPTYILLKPNLLYGDYFFNADIARSKSESKNNHWSTSKNKQILKKDLRLYKEIKLDISSIIFKIIKVEKNYINNKLIIYKIENIALLIDENTKVVEFIFNYHNNLSFSKYMIKINMLKAGQLIESGYLKQNSVNDLANMFGYSSRSAFYSKFKEFNDSAPSQY
ncbi:MAG: helix-turn-helix transcriptional regulator [Flavobacteriaceae bacterium]|nr:helix-turn-helix transcriptional regulator [Flavobacteriaceae bacterium]